MKDQEVIEDVGQSPKERQREREMGGKKVPISYTGIILDDRSRNRFLNTLKDLIPDGWKEVAHHMTVNMGEAKPEHIKYLNFPINLIGTHIGMNDKAIAVAVEGFDSKKGVPHITLAVNEKEGGKPKHSNDIDEWKPLKRKLFLKGYLEEVPFNL
jgi:hypothetical protein